MQDSHSKTHAKKGELQTGSAGQDNLKRDPEEIRHDIQESRSNLNHTIGALQEKLNPRNFARSVSENVRSKAAEGWRRVSESSERAYHKSRDRAQQAYHATRERADHAVNDYPLATAGAVLGLGILMGSLLPLSRVERRFASRAGTAREKVDRKLSELVSKGNRAIDQSLGGAESGQESGFSGKTEGSRSISG